MGEGRHGRLRSLLADLDYPHNHRFNIFKHQAGGDSRSGDTSRSQEFGSHPVLSGGRGTVMRRTVDLDIEAGLGAVEVQHKRARRMLATEFEAAGAFAKFPPQNDLGE